MKHFLPAAALAALALGACSLAGDITPPPALATAQAEGLGFPPTEAPAVVPDRAPNLASGAAIYAEKCLPCHGESGGGDGPQAGQLPNPPTAFTAPDIAQKANLQDWFDVVTKGRFDRFMPGFSSLDDGERWDVVGYALSLGLPGDTLETGRQIYQESCAGCHGPDGSGIGANSDLTSPAFQAGTSWLAIYGIVTDGVGDSMPSFSETLSDSDRWSVAAYVRSIGLAGKAVPAQGPTPRTPAATAAATGSPEAPGSTPAVAGAAIQGRVTNGTAGGPLPNGLQITLHGFDADQEAVTLTTPLAGGGSFSFTGLERVAARRYVATTEYEGVPYASEIAELDPAASVTDLPITVYESTPSPEAVRVSRLHLLFDFPDPNVMQVVELWLLSNGSDRTVVDSDQGALDVVLPEGASGLSLDGGTVGDRFELTPTGFRDRQAVTPGENTSELIFSYNLPYSKGLEFARKVDYPVEAVVAMTPDGGPQVTGNELQDLGVREVSGTGLHTYQMGPQPAGATIDLTFQGGGASVTSQLASISPVLFGAAALLLALVAAGLIWYRPRRAASPVADEPDEEGILWAIASLDNDHAAGKVDEDTYRRRREELKRRLGRSGDGD
jgi:mono/diheme cytochrome c family protein